MIEINPDAQSIADQLDRERKSGKLRGPMHGIPVLIKDNIDTHDRMQTTAGSLALAGNIAAKDAFIVAQLRKAGAVILGKTNLSEWANFRSNNSSSGWSSRGGQTKNPHVLGRNPSGSSSGSGSAVAAAVWVVGGGMGTGGVPVLDDRIYVLTPDAAVVELVQGATAVDFAYSVHTNVGHRCRGARVDGHLVPLSTPLRNGQTVDIITAKEGGPSPDWLNPELGFLNSQRARAKVRAWFNAQALTETMARGREAVEKLLQREGKTAVRLDDLAAQLGFNSADDLFEVVGKDEFSLRNIEIVLRPPETVQALDDTCPLYPSDAAQA